MAKSFTNEEDIVKLQIINLAAKLYLTNSKQTKLLTQYVLNLAKYDQNYDIRDRARFIRQLIVPTEKSGALSKYAKKLFLALKPAPVLESRPLPVGFIVPPAECQGWGLPGAADWPEAAPDPSVRNVEVKESVRAVGTVTYRDTGPSGISRGPKRWREARVAPVPEQCLRGVFALLERVTTLTSVPEWTKCSSREKRKEKKVEKPFYSDSEGESGPTESADSESDSASSSESGSGSEESRSGSESEESEEGSESEEEEEEEEEEEKKDKKKKKKEFKEASTRNEQSSEEEERKHERKSKQRKSDSESESDEEDESESESSQSESEDSESEAEASESKPSFKPVKTESRKEKKEMSLLDLDDCEFFSFLLSSPVKEN
ncbi:hypothetical protein INR49_004804, partial [Caranx melampygus]